VTTATTRLAPSPTGALHLGNARTFVITWALARQRGWRIVLRIEDLDGPRVKPEAIDGIVDTLAWLGLDWDEGPIVQSHEPQPHEMAMRTLAEAGLAYPCELTRAQIEAAASAPQEGAHDTAFPASLRPVDVPRVFSDPTKNWRFVVPSELVEVRDEFAGTQRFNVAEIVGDFVIWTKRGQPSYQLAVVVDDHRQGITHVVRGNDLLDSAARQMLLYRGLGLGPAPEYLHLPLVRGEDGKRLAKRHGDTRVDAYREAGVRPERVLGLIAAWSGFGGPRREISAAEFCAGFDLRTMPREDVTFSPEHDSWLRSK
jgi:glutamyl-tRNA synthetase